MARKCFFDKVETKGRPKMVLNEDGIEEVTNLAMIGCTDEEIAASMDCSIKMLYNASNGKAYEMAKKKGAQKGRASLRRMQFKAARNGNVSMQIFLGKQILGQSDNPQPVVNEILKEDDPITLAIKKSMEGGIEKDESHLLQLSSDERRTESSETTEEKN